MSDFNIKTAGQNGFVRLERVKRANYLKTNRLGRTSTGQNGFFDRTNQFCPAVPKKTSIHLISNNFNRTKIVLSGGHGTQTNRTFFRIPLGYGNVRRVLAVPGTLVGRVV